MLGSILRNMLLPGRQIPPPDATRPRVLNVGGGSKAMAIPSHYDGWEHLLLDVDPRGAPDIVCDARELEALDASQFDAIYCSHNLEHYYQHDSAKVLRGFRHLLKHDGFAEIKVPDLESVIRRVIESKMDLGDVLYQSPRGPISALDVIYGYGTEIEQTGKDYYAHKTGFTAKLLYEALERAGFASVHVYVVADAFELRAFAFRSQPTTAQQQLLGLSA
jgi:SAM-dependent methyltransferase